MAPGIVGIRIRRGDTVFHVHGDQAGAEGVWLAKGQVNGLYDAPVRTTYKRGAFQVGSTYKGTAWQHRDLELGFHLVDTISDSYEWNESAFRQIFDYREDPWSEDPQPTVIEVETELSGVRKLNVLMYEEPDFAPDLDPMMNQHGNLILKLRAGDPLWHGVDITSEFSAETTSASGHIDVENPGDQIMYHRWILTPATWSLPDVQWVGDPGERHPGGDHAARTVDDITITTANGGAVGELDRQQLMWRDAADTNLLGQLGGSKILVYPIPPYTPPSELVISYSAAPAGGAMAQLVQPRRWSRPWGMEPVTVTTSVVGSDTTTRFTSAGSYSYEIPRWADKLDIIVVGGGGGGGGGYGLWYGQGGGAASWGFTTVERGVGIPTDTTHIGGVVGRGGIGGAFALDGGDGQATTAVATGMTTVSGAGGQGSSHTWFGWPSGSGEAATDQTYNSRPYPGGDNQMTFGAAGNTPGGGGAGGFWTGGVGAVGQVWIRAYQVSEVVQPAGVALTLTESTPTVNIVMVVPTGASLTATGTAPDVRVT